MIIDVLIGEQQQRKWHEELVRRLRNLPDAEIRIRLTNGPRPIALRRLQRLLWLERSLHRIEAGGLARGTLRESPRVAPESSPNMPDVTLDLSDRPAPGHWSVQYNGIPGERGAVDTLRAGHLPVVRVVDGAGVTRATGRPGSEVPGLMSTALADLSAGVTTLIVGAVTGHRFATPDLDAGSEASSGEQRPRSFTELAARRTAGAVLRLAYRIGFRSPHWRVGWRATSNGIAGTRGNSTDGTDGAIMTGHLAGASWADVADDGFRFYADPFPFEYRGHTHLFVEELDHRLGKGVISVAPWSALGQAGPFETVLRHDVHLSYPFVLEHAGDVWMIPETSGAGRIELYRASEYPHAWELHSVLVNDVIASDATPFQHDGRWWLAATVGLGGSLSDTLYLWTAPDLLGPWTAHQHNPVLVDIASARPAGRVELRDGRLLRPVQDGRAGYGAAMSVTEITRLDDDAFEQSVIARYTAGADWAGTRVHTLNSAGGIEVIDGSRLMPRWRGSRRRA